MSAARWTVPALVLLLGVMATLMLEALREETATIDEPIYLACGYMHWRHPDFGSIPSNRRWQGYCTAYRVCFWLWSAGALHKIVQK